MQFPQHLVLKGASICLVPLETDHATTLFELLQYEGLNTSPILSLPQTLEATEQYVATAVQWREDGTAFPFVTTLRSTGEIIGSTRFANFAPEHKRVEIGWTWLSTKFQRSFANTETKYLMLKYAFEELGLIRVELRANALNTKSRAAMERIGAQYEGCLRQYIIAANGIVRDTVYYSILAGEWSENVKKRLETMIESH